ncbi:HAD family hydrolase [Salinisphaera hydrothermalis]|uniref:HAD family hydrolase n=1 Tax=Salinisphaera hydrothermalis TaxID=563188 RepID=UPI0033416D4D
MRKKAPAQDRSSLTGVQAIAFDVFGTLCEADPMGDLLRWQRGLPATERRRLRDDWMCGRIGFAELTQYGETAAAPPVEVLEYQAQASASTTRLLASAEPVLEELKCRGYPMACVSNLAPPFGPPVRQVLAPWIEHYVFSYEVGARKPDPSLFDAVCEALKLSPQRVLMVGDSPRSDIDGASAFGMPSMLVNQKNAAESLPIDQLVKGLPIRRR